LAMSFSFQTLCVRNHWFQRLRLRNRSFLWCPGWGTQ